MAYTSREIMTAMGNHYRPKDSTETGESGTQEGLRYTGPDLDDDIIKDFGDVGSLTEEEPDLPEPMIDTQQASTIASTSAGTKRKYDIGEVPFAKKPKVPENFLTMSEGALARWVRDMPPTFRNELFDRRRDLLQTKHVGTARIWLERMNGEGFEYLRNENPLSEASLSKLNKWKFKLGKSYRKDQRGMREFLKNVLLKDPRIDGKVRVIRERDGRSGKEEERGEGTCVAPKVRMENISDYSKRPTGDSLPQQVAPTQNKLVESHKSNGKKGSSPPSRVGGFAEEDSPEHTNSFKSNNLGIDGNCNGPDESNKIRRNSKDENSDDEYHASKKRKADLSIPSHHLEEAIDDTDSDISISLPVRTNRPKDRPRAQRPPPDANGNQSFDSQITIADSTVEMYIGRAVYFLNPSDATLFLPWDTTRNDWPHGTTSLPDFAHLGPSDFYTWRKANPDFLFHPNGDYTTYLAQLHMHYKRTFLHEPDANFSAVWIHDQTVFTPALRAELRAHGDDRVRNGEIRRRMMEAYEPDLLERIERMPKPKAAVPKITIQVGTSDDPESFDSEVDGRKEGRCGASSPMDADKLAPAGRYGLRKAPKPSVKKRGNDMGV